MVPAKPFISIVLTIYKKNKPWYCEALCNYFNFFNGMFGKSALPYSIYYCNYYSSRRELLYTIEKIEEIRNKSAVKRLILSEKLQNNKNN